MKKLFVMLAMVALVSTLIFTGCAAPAPTPVPTPTTSPTTPATSAPETINLKFAMFFPGTSGPSQVWESFCKEIESRTDGRVKITYYPGGSLVGGVPMADGVETGITDIGYISIGFVPGRFPVMEANAMPTGYASAYIGTHAADDLWRKYRPKEFDNYHVIAWNNCGPQSFWSNTPIRTMDDLKGKKIRAIGRNADAMKLLGMSPVGTPIGECYDAISKGVVDVMLFPFEVGKTWKFAEVCDYLTVSWVIGGAGFVTAMNKASWENLPPDIQKIFDEVSDQWVEESALVWNEIDVFGHDYNLENGVEYIFPDDAEVAKWKAAIAPLTEVYVKDMVERGFTETEARGYVNYLIERCDYWLKVQAEKGIKSPSGPPEIRL